MLGFASQPLAHRIPTDEIPATALDGDRFPAGGSAAGGISESLQLCESADAGKGAGEDRPGTDRGSICEFVVA